MHNLLVLAALLLSGGTLADRLGARNVFQLGLDGFVVASLACGLAPNLTVLIAARTVQGAGAALAGLTFALIEGGHVGLTPAVLAGAAVFVAGLAAFVAIECAVAAPMLPLRLFRNATFASGNAVGLLINLGFAASCS